MERRELVAKPTRAVIPGGGSSDLARAFLLAEEYEAAGHADEAEGIYRGLLLAVPDQPVVLHNLALLLHAKKDVPEAEQLLRKAIAVAPGEPGFHNSLGALQYDLGRYAEAEASFQSAIRLDQGYAEARYNLGVVYEAQGRDEEAFTALHESLEQRADDPRTLTRYAVQLCARAEYGAALTCLDAAVTNAPGSFDAHYYRADVLAKLERHPEALRELAFAEQLRPGAFETAFARANALRSMGEHDQALLAYQDLITLHPQRAEIHAEFNRLLWEVDRRDLFLQSFEYAKSRVGELPDLLNLEGAFRLRAEQFQRAERVLRRSQELAPDDGASAGLLARAIAARGKFEESIPLFKKAINAEPSKAVHRQEYGFTLLKAGMPDQAARLFEQCLPIDPDDQLVLAGLALAYRTTNPERYRRWVDFASHVKIFDLAPPAGFADRNEFNTALGEELDRLHFGKAAPVDQTLRGGTQTAGQLLERREPCIQQLRRGFESAVADYIRGLSNDPGHPLSRRKQDAFSFSGSWSCRLRSSGYHRNHVHPKGWISSVYYVRLPKVNADGASQAGWLKFGESQFDLGGNDLPEYLIRPAVGRLVLFPSYFWHGTVPFRDQGDRLTVAFDAVPRSGASAAVS